MMKYQVIYQGYEPEPNQVITDPIDFNTANWLACTMQAELPDKDSGFYVVEPIFNESREVLDGQ